MVRHTDEIETGLVIINSPQIPEKVVNIMEKSVLSMD